MSSDNKPLELNYNSEEAERILQNTFSNLPDGVEVYLVSGAVRNALYRMYHGTILTQRDYDQVITKGSKEYAAYLKSNDFNERPYPSRQDEQVVYSKPLNDEAKAGDSYVNWLVFDMHTVDGTTIEENIINNAAFTINGCAISARDLFIKSSEEAVIQVLPTAIQDIKDKKIRLNMEGYRNFPSAFYAMLRFMSVGFSAPTPEEVQFLLKELPNLEHARFERNVYKIWDYVGGEDKARDLVKSVGVNLDVFDEEVVKSKI